MKAFLKGYIPERALIVIAQFLTKKNKHEITNLVVYSAFLDKKRSTNVI